MPSEYPEMYRIPAASVRKVPTLFSSGTGVGVGVGVGLEEEEEEPPPPPPPEEDPLSEMVLAVT